MAMEQKGKKRAGEERRQGNNSKGTNTEEDKCEKQDSILFSEKSSQEIATVSR